VCGLRLICDHGSTLSFARVRCSPQRGGNMLAQGNALGTGTQVCGSPERAQHERHPQVMTMLEEPRMFMGRHRIESGERYVGAERLLRPFRALWHCVPQTQAVAVG